MSRSPFKIDGPTVISFSGGRTSAYVLHRYLKENGGLSNNVNVCFANTRKEMEQTLEQAPLMGDGNLPPPFNAQSEKP